MLELKFVCALEESIDANIRAYLRGKTAQRDRWVESLWGAVWGVIGLYAAMRLLEGKWPPLWFMPLGLICGYLLHFFTFRYNVASRITRDIRKHRGKDKPVEVFYRISGGELHVCGRGMEAIYQLEDIDWVGKDQHYLEFRFQDLIHFALPLRVFEAEGQTSLEDFIRGLGEHECLDLTENSGGLKGAVPPPAPKDIHGGVQMSTLPLWLGVFACTILGLAALILSSKLAGMEGATSPVGLIGMAMMAVGLISGAVLLWWRKPRGRRK